MQTANNPISAKVSVDEEGRRRSNINLTVAVTNETKEKIDVVNVWLQSSDSDSKQLLAWWTDKCETYKLIRGIEKDETQYVKFELQIPPQLQSKQYRYVVYVEALGDVGSRILFPQTLEVLPSDDRGDLGWEIDPPMKRENPLEVEVGQSRLVKVRVQNISDITESYTLECDFNLNWYKIIYPFNRNLLQVNPGDTEEIGLEFNIPKSATSKVYSFTLRLKPNNNDSFEKLFTEIIYLRVKEFYGGQDEGVLLQINPRKVLLSASNGQNYEGIFDLYLKNISNINRSVAIETNFEFQDDLKCKFLRKDRYGRESSQAEPGPGSALYRVQP